MLKVVSPFSCWFEYHLLQQDEYKKAQCYFIDIFVGFLHHCIRLEIMFDFSAIIFGYNFFKGKKSNIFHFLLPLHSIVSIFFFSLLSISLGFLYNILDVQNSHPLHFELPINPSTKKNNKVTIWGLFFFIQNLILKNCF